MTQNDPHTQDRYPALTVENFAKSITRDRERLENKEHVYRILMLHDLYDHLRDHDIETVHLLKDIDASYMIVGLRYRGATETVSQQIDEEIGEIFDQSPLTWDDLATVDPHNSDLSLTLDLTVSPGNVSRAGAMQLMSNAMPQEF